MRKPFPGGLGSTGLWTSHPLPPPSPTLLSAWHRAVPGLPGVKVSWKEREHRKPFYGKLPHPLNFPLCESSEFPPPAALRQLPHMARTLQRPSPQQDSRILRWPLKQIQPGLGWAGSEQRVPVFASLGCFRPIWLPPWSLRNRGQLSHPLHICLPHRVRNF